MKTHRNLHLNRFFYEQFLKTRIFEVREQLDHQELLRRISFLAGFAWRNHTGLFFDDRLENPLYRLGEQLETCLDSRSLQRCLQQASRFEGQSYAVIHLATRLFDVGGHTRVLYQMITRNPDPRQLVLLTDQTVQKVPDWFRQGVAPVPIHSLQMSGSLLERAWLLRYLARRSRLVMLYHHPDDVVPVLALSTSKLPPVLLQDHAHSWFWLGASVIDRILSPSAFHEAIARKWRPLKQVTHFPFTQLPDLDLSFDASAKRDAKERLGIAPATVCLLTIGTTEKFIPNQQYDFFRTAQAILNRFQTVELYVIGIEDSQELQQRFQIAGDRIHLMGYQSDLTDFYQAADICLDALPQPSLGATLYAALIGLACPMFKYGSSNVFNGRNLFESPLYREHIGVVATEQEYLDKLGYLISNPDLRISIAQEIRNGFNWISNQKSLGANLQHILEESSRLVHCPQPLPAAFSHDDPDSCEIADAGAAQDIHTRLMQFDTWLSSSEKLRLLLQLAVRPDFAAEVLRLLGSILVRKGRGTIARLAGNRRNHGTHDRILPAAISPDSGE